MTKTKSSHDTWRPAGGKPPTGNEDRQDHQKRGYRSRSPSRDRKRSPPPRNPRKRKVVVDTYIPGASPSNEPSGPPRERERERDFDHRGRDRDREHREREHRDRDHRDKDRDHRDTRDHRDHRDHRERDRGDRGDRGDRDRDRNRDRDRRRERSRSRDRRRSPTPRRRSASPLRPSHDEPPKPQEAQSHIDLQVQSVVHSKSPKRLHSDSPGNRSSKRSKREGRSRSPRRRSPENRATSHKHRSRRSRSRSPRRRSPAEPRKSRRDSPGRKDEFEGTRNREPERRHRSPFEKDVGAPRGPRYRSPLRSERYHKGHPGSYDREFSPRRSHSPSSFSKGRPDKRPRRRKSPRHRKQSPLPRNSNSPGPQRPTTDSPDDIISTLATKKGSNDNAPREETHRELDSRSRLSAEPSSSKHGISAKPISHHPSTEPVRSLSPWSKRRHLGDAPPLRDNRSRESLRPSRPAPPPFSKGPREKDFDRRGPPPPSNARSRRRKQRRGAETYNPGDERYRNSASPHREFGTGSNAMLAGSNAQDYPDEDDRASSVSSIDSRGNHRRSIEKSPYSGRHERKIESNETNAPAPDDAAPSPKETGTPEQQPPPPASPPPPPPAESREDREDRDAALMPPPNAPRGPRSESLLDVPPKPSPIDASKGKVRFSLSGTTPKGKLPTGPRNQEFGFVRRVPGTASNSVPVAPRKHVTPTSAFTEAPPPAPKATKTLPTPRVLISRKLPFDRVGLVGEGTYGQVFKAKNWVTGQLVALKRVRMTAEKDGFPITAAREIKILQSLAKGRDGDKIIHLLDNMVEQNGFYMIFEYMDHDLTGILHHPTYRLTEANIKDLAHQFFSGLAHIHRSGILHRDIKSSNILINRHGCLKIADFGLARQYDKLRSDQHYTNRIITLWYRPVEILLGETVYTTGPDVWSAGCVFMELFTRKAIFQGSNEITQLDIIWNLLGTPTFSSWPGWKDTAWYSMLRPEHYYKPIFNDRFKRSVPADALALAARIFTYDPKKRPTAEEVLADPYFTNEPKAERTVSIETIEGEWHELESKKNRKREREERQNAARQAKQP
ncbi:hypothetical protein ABW21_db0202071 [Orbilia brochopaga]|nr:hypothetical protein ABW21_db0202071 [Drechslerella brochopaga]